MGLGKRHRGTGNKAGSKGKRLKVLIFDDDKVFCDITHTCLLLRDKISLIHICHGIEDYVNNHEINRHIYDYAFIDWCYNQQVYNGELVYEHIKAKNKIIVSAMYENDELRFFLKKRKVSFIGKPFNMKHLDMVMGI